MASTVLRDAIWGDIALGERELALIDTRAFQRLRRVRQLGFTDLVFPGARHTRFEHSLGVYHLARLALDRLASIPGSPRIEDADRRVFLAAALLHDIGHYPFSHALEELEVAAIRRHEDIARDVICGDEVSEVLRDLWDVSPERVAIFVSGPARGDVPLSDEDMLLRTVLDSGLDVDKLDYLVRDARGANVPYGIVDVQRLIGCLTVWRDPDGRPRLAVETKGIAALGSLVFAKHLMFSTVYWHHACRAAVAMLLRAVQEALTAEVIRPPELEQADDASLVTMLAADPMPQLTRGLSDRISARRLYKRSGAVDADDPRFGALERLWYRPAVRRATEDGWAAEVGVAPGGVLLDIPEPRRIAVDLPVVDPEGTVSDWDRVSGLSSGDLDRLQRRARKIRTFAADDESARALRHRSSSTAVVLPDRD